MMRSAVAAILAAVLSAGSIAASQPETLAGCLQPGSEKGSFILTIEGAQQTVPVMSTKVGLTEHLGREVSLTGRTGTFRGESIFKVTRLVVVDRSCR